MLIAVSTDNGTHISGHFGRCNFFSIWKVTDGSPEFIGLRPNSFTQHATGDAPLPGGMSLAPPAGEVEGYPLKNYSPTETLVQKGYSHTSVLEGLADVECVIAAGMGRRIIMDFERNKINYFITDEGNIETAIKNLVDGSLDSGPGCEGGHRR